MDSWEYPNHTLSAPIKSQYVFLHYEIILYRNQTQTQCVTLFGHTKAKLDVQKYAEHSCRLCRHMQMHTFTLCFLLSNKCIIQGTDSLAASLLSSY